MFPSPVLLSLTVSTSLAAVLDTHLVEEQQRQTDCCSQVIILVQNQTIPSTDL